MKTKKLFFIVLCILALYAFGHTCIIEFKGHIATEVTAKSNRFLVIAHRASSPDAPENTLAAIQQSLALGVDACEIDVRCTKDSRVILMHDGDVSRTTNGKGEVARMTFAELRSLDAGKWKSPKYAGQTVPSIEEVIELLQGTGVAVIDIKDIAAVEKITTIARNNPLANIIIQSDDRDILKLADSLNKQVLLSWVCKDFPFTAITPARKAKWLIKNASGPKIDIVNIHYTLLSPEIINRLHERHISVWAWTVNHPEIANYLMNWGIDGIISDNPAEIKIIRDTIGERATLNQK